MPRVRIFSENLLIGHADLFAADPPMGVASGMFRPTPAYARIRPIVVAVFSGERGRWEDLDLRAVTEDGVSLEAAGGITIDDLFDEEMPPPEVWVAGIGNSGDGGDRYDEWFAQDPHYRSYHAR